MTAPSLPHQDNRTSDPLIVSLLLAGALHLLVILGVSFTVEAPSERDTPPPLDIALVPKHNTETPEQADYLAAHSQSGSGNVDEKIKPVPAQEAQQASAPPPTPTQPQPQVMTRAEADATVVTSDTPPKPDEPRPSASELIERSLEMVNLNQQLKQSMQAYSERPRKKFISASTREFKYANYMNDWVSKVERVGNLNYPDEARRAGVSGNLLLQVAMNPDGSVRDIKVLKSSGHKVLDDAARRIVELASPFPPLPANIRDETDELYITRTWEFQSGGWRSR